MADEQNAAHPDQEDQEKPAEPPDWALDRPELIRRLASRPDRLRLALTGGAASGKSRVAGLLSSLGAKHVDLDDLSRKVSAPGTAGFRAVAELLGPDYIGPDGALNREKIGRAVFADPAARRGLEDALHPLIWEALGLELAALDEEPALVISVPLLFEKNLNTFFRPIVLVFASPAAQVSRLLARRPGLSPAEAELILKAQWPTAPKIKGSDFIINNDGEWAATEAQVRTLWPRLLAGEYPLYATQ